MPGGILAIVNAAKYGVHHGLTASASLTSGVELTSSITRFAVRTSLRSRFGPASRAIFTGACADAVHFSPQHRVRLATVAGGARSKGHGRPPAKVSRSRSARQVRPVPKGNSHISVVPGTRRRFRIACHFPWFWVR